MGFIARSAARSTCKAGGSLSAAAFGIAIIMLAAQIILPLAILALIATIIYAIVVITVRRYQATHAPVAPTAVQVAQRNLEQARREETAAWAELARLEGRPLSSYTAQREAVLARAMRSNQAAVSDRR